MKNRILIGLLAIGLAFTSCDDDDNEVIDNGSEVNAGTITGGPYNFQVDGIPDFATDLGLDDAESVGDNSSWVITDADGMILGLPPTLEAAQMVNFDDPGPGVCLIWYLRFNGELEGAEMGANANDLSGDFDLSNSIEVNRVQNVVPGVISGGPYEFDVDDMADFATDLDVDDSMATGANSTWVITDDQLNILGLPPTLEATQGVDFDAAGTGVCLIWYLRFNDGLEGAEMGANAADLQGEFALSNSIEVIRNEVTNAGTISGGPYEFQVDGIPDFATDLTLDATRASGENSTWVITDEQGNILGLPPTLEAAQMVNFDGAGPGICFIWYLRFNGELMGADMGANANDLQGDFDLSNPIEVNRVQNVVPGVISGGPYVFDVDGTADFATDLGVDSSMATGANSTWVITDDKLNILGLPPTLQAAQGVNFDGAGTGVCLIWYLRFNDGLQGAVMGANAADLEGEFALSNSIEVVRN
ncbi:hypothetical protein NBT05_15875 [Aquimarina sp. ERC-38]|uniref:hypothetical protein n=1 Tax=Aquimarina sp. ERC-38 TaxID=2949996 RepID=UPI002245EA16|nr:hypothetical protein [Aquimarina sp. ERC-38]UZO80418.1 hypothetical protein NBT05_15875 [Aquimarina sp. ERC-38]